MDGETVMAREYKKYKDYTAEERAKYVRLGVRPFKSTTTTVKNIRPKDDKKGTTAPTVNTGAKKETRTSSRNYKRPRIGGDVTTNTTNKKGDYRSPKLKDAAKVTPYKTTKKYKPAAQTTTPFNQKEKEKSKEKKVKDFGDLKGTTKPVVKKVEEKKPVVKKVEEKKVVKKSDDRFVPKPTENNVSTDAGDYSKSVLYTIGGLIVTGAAANKYSKRIQKIYKAMKKQPEKFKNLFNKAKDIFKKKESPLKKLDLTKGRSYADPKKKVRKVKKKVQSYKGNKVKPKVDMPQYLGNKGGQVVYRKKPGAIGTGQALRGYGATRKK
jgi:hypothetical protein